MPDSANPPRPFRVAIIGGAIGGLSTALFLHHFCNAPGAPAKVAIDVYEQASEYREIGAGVGIGINAVRLLYRLGPEMAEACEAITGDARDVWFSFARWDTGEVVVEVPQQPRVKGQASHLSVARTDFLDVLLRLIRERGAAKLWTRKRCVAVEDLGDSVRIAFEDGTHAEADFVIGSDGIHSAVRTQYVRDNAQYSGKIAYRGVVPIAPLRTPWPYPSYKVMWVAKGRHFLTFPMAGDRQLNVVAFVTKDESEIPDLRESWSAECDPALIAADFAGFCDDVQDIVKLMPERPSRWRINDREPLARWNYAGGKVVLLGDAAHAMTPHQGAGAGQSIEDGYILGRALGDFLNLAVDEREKRGGLQAWTELYQDVRMPRAKQVQRTSREAGDLYELKLPCFEGKSYDECIPILGEKLGRRMTWIWGEDLDNAYEAAKAKMMGSPALQLSPPQEPSGNIDKSRPEELGHVLPQKVVGAGRARPTVEVVP